MFARFPARQGLCVVLMAILTACASPPPSEFAEITFEHRPKIRLDVASIDIEVAYRGPLKEPNVEHTMQISPAAAATRWATDRLQAVGNVRRARYIIRNASVVEERLDVTTGIEGVLTVDQAARYTQRVAVEIQILDGSRVEADLKAEATRSITVPEDTSLREREEVLYRLNEDTMRDLDLELESAIREAFAAYVVL